MSVLVPYKGLQVVSPDPTGEGGKSINDNFVYIADVLEGITPAGLDTQIQFNNSGAFGASVGLTWNGTTLAATNLSGNGSALTALNGSNISSGTVADVRLSANITRLDTEQSWSATQNFGSVDALNLLLRSAGTVSQTNLILYSEQFDNVAWGLNQVTIAANTTTAPDGTVTAETITENAITSSFYMGQIKTVTVSGNYYYSIYVKANGRPKVRLRVLNSIEGPFADFDLSTGLSTSSGNGAGFGSLLDNFGIANAGNGWYRIWVSGKYPAGSPVSGFPTLSFLNAVNNPVYLGDGVSGVYVWGAQFVLGTASFGYIQTLGVAVAASFPSRVTIKSTAVETDHRILRVPLLGADKYIAVTTNSDGSVLAGANTQIQFNDGGSAFGADTVFVWDKINNRLGVGTTSPTTTFDLFGDMSVGQRNFAMQAEVPAFVGPGLTVAGYSVSIFASTAFTPPGGPHPSSSANGGSITLKAGSGANYQGGNSGSAGSVFIEAGSDYPFAPSFTLDLRYVGGVSGSGSLSATTVQTVTINDTATVVRLNAVAGFATEIKDEAGATWITVSGSDTTISSNAITYIDGATEVRIDSGTTPTVSIGTLFSTNITIGNTTADVIVNGDTLTFNDALGNPQLSFTSTLNTIGNAGATVPLDLIGSDLTLNDGGFARLSFGATTALLINDEAGTQQASFLSTQNTIGTVGTPLTLDGLTVTINGTVSVANDLLPVTNNTSDLGSASLKFKDGYFAGKLTVDGLIDPSGLLLTDGTGETPVAGLMIWNSGTSKFQFCLDGATFVDIATGNSVSSSSTNSWTALQTFEDGNVRMESGNVNVMQWYTQGASGPFQMKIGVGGGLFFHSTLDIDVAGNDFYFYRKGNYIILSDQIGATGNYKYIDITDNTATWQYSTSEP